MTSSKKHTKHALLTKPTVGSFARNEWAIIGAPCDVIRDLVYRLASLTSENILFIDESHDHSAQVGNLSIAVKKGEGNDFNTSRSWDRYENFDAFDAYDYVFVNGNHFKANKQLIILDERKKESLSRKLDRLTDVVAIVKPEGSKGSYPFLESYITSETPQISLENTALIWEVVRHSFVVPPLKALVLAGGRSQRMGEDKGQIAYHGQDQVSHMNMVLQELGIEAYVSCRKEQEDLYQGFSVVTDSFLGLGPFGAIASAFLSDPNAAWLIVPCDLPFLGKASLEMLISNRNPIKYATAFLNNETRFPEPLISIWEPKMYGRLFQFLVQGYSCPRKVLINSDVALVHVDDQQFMTNVNTPEERELAEGLLKKSR